VAASHAALRALRQQVAPLADINNDGKLDYAEFCAFVRERELGERQCNFLELGHRNLRADQRMRDVERRRRQRGAGAIGQGWRDGGLLRRPRQCPQLSAAAP
jgi:hypothetical protein